jgi:hypothetical protein
VALLGSMHYELRNLSYINIIAVELTCIIHANVDSMIFSAWIPSDDTPVVGTMNNIVTNWIFKPMTCTQDNIQVSL